MIFGNQRINTQPCTQAEANQNWSVVNNLLVQFQQTIDNGTTSDHKVALNPADQANATANYLHVKVNQSDLGSYPGLIDVKSQTIGDSTEQFYGDLTTLNNWDAGLVQRLQNSTGE